MWYVIWTSTGMEEKTALVVRDMACQRRCFVPRKKVQIRRKGDWVLETKTLFPGYLFVDTEDIESLVQELFKMEGFHTVLSIEKKYYPLSGEDAILTEKLYESEGVLDVSQGIIAGDRIIVTSGPLKGREGLIRKIDRHKRIASIEINLFNQTIRGTVGLEIVEKRP